MFNMGKADRIVRIAVGLAITSLAFFGPTTPWALLGLIPLVTGLVGICPAYLPFRFSTKGTDTEAS